jgi:hypothetical protein
MVWDGGTLYYFRQTGSSPYIGLVRLDTHGAADINFIQFLGKDNAGNDQEYARITAAAQAVTDGSEQGSLTFGTANGSGVLTNYAFLNRYTFGPASPSALGLGYAGGRWSATYTDTIELGADSDTTLSRDQAGVMAVEGKRVLTQNFAAVQNTTSGTAFDFTSIPSWVREIDVIFNGVSLSGTDQIHIQIGDSGGIETSGYAAAFALPYGTNGVTSGIGTAAFPLAVTAAGDTLDGIVSLKNITGNVWICSGMVNMRVGVTGICLVSGTKTLSATLDRVRITRSGSNTFDAGQVNICYR